MGSETQEKERVRYSDRKSIIADPRARSGRKIRILRTDGDGIFDQSKRFQELKDRENFIRERPAPYDHQQSAVIDRECRTLLEGVDIFLHFCLLHTDPANLLLCIHLARGLFSCQWT